MWFVLAVALLPSVLPSEENTLSGTIFNAETNIPLFNCNVSILPNRKGTSTDKTGRFELQLSSGQYEIVVTHIGFRKFTREIQLTKTLNLEIGLQPALLQAESVTVFGRDESAAGLESISGIDIRRMPTVYSDVLRTVKILPGVASNNELTSAYNVRGGNHDENLVYLNGYEIYRPALLRQGTAENQSLVNPDLAHDLKFYAGGFPARLGDKLTSALEVDYRDGYPADIQGTIRANLLNYGIALRNRTGRLSWAAGLRYANPQIFVNKLQTSGNYRPRFFDLQALLNYELNDAASLELFFLNTDNKFDLTPDFWRGTFGSGLNDVKAVEIAWQGQRRYDLGTRLIGLTGTYRLANAGSLSLRFSRYSTQETDDIDLRGDVFFVPNAVFPSAGRTFLKTRAEQADNSFRMRNHTVQTEFSRAGSRHRFHAGIGVKWTDMHSNLDESVIERSDQTFPEETVTRLGKQSQAFTSASVFVQDDLILSEKWQLGLGVRGLHYALTGENLLSPRGSLRFVPREQTRFHLTSGLYYQAPFFHEIRDKDELTARTLRSQKAAHFLFGVEHDFPTGLNLKTEAFFKRLDNIIPYYQEQLQLIYADANSHEGFAYGFDVLLQGEIVKGVKSWLSYGYLKSRERKKGTRDYQRRILDQTHTFRFFLQDKVPHLPNVQSHLRILYGSGFLYHPQRVVTDPVSGIASLEIDFDRKRKFKHYLRLDLGLTAEIKLTNRRYLLLTIEALNAWNVVNVADYSFVHIPQLSNRAPVQIPHILTRRFFNLGAELRL